MLQIIYKFKVKERQVQVNKQPAVKRSRSVSWDI